MGMTLYPSSFLCLISGFLTCLILCPEILFYEKHVINPSVFLSNLFWCKLVSPPRLEAVLLPAARQSFALPADTSHPQDGAGLLCSPLQNLASEWRGTNPPSAEPEGGFALTLPVLFCLPVWRPPCSVPATWWE